MEVYIQEDCPYAIHTPAGVSARLAALGNAVGQPPVVAIGDTLEHRLDGIACYHSQVRVIFRLMDDFRRTVPAFAETTGGELRSAERFWPVP